VCLPLYLIATYRKFSGEFNMADNDEAAIEALIQAKGLNAPRLRPGDIDCLIVGETFTILPSGRTMICELTLKNGFTVRGESSVVSAENFDLETGWTVSRKDARRKIWQLEAYLLKERLYQAAKDSHGGY
jgi:hypothetical protein